MFSMKLMIDTAGLTLQTIHSNLCGSQRQMIAEDMSRLDTVNAVPTETRRVLLDIRQKNDVMRSLR